MPINRSFLCNTALTTPIFIAFGVSNALAADVAQGGAAYTLDDSLPAVSGLNGKLSIEGGGTQPGFDLGFLPFDDDFEGGVKAKGSVSVPLGHRFGMQGDATIGSVQGEVYGHGAGHLFWRNPALGLLGGYGSWTIWDDVDAYRLGVEGEVYLDRFTLSGIVGGEWGDVDEGVFTIGDVNYYATDNFKLGVGHRYTEEAGHAVAFGAEFQAYSTASTGVSLFADARFGEDDYQSIFAGLRLYFGEDKSLIRRHREDDPPVRDEDQSVISCTNGVNAVDAIIADGIAAPAIGAIALDSAADSLFLPKIPCNKDFRIRPL